MQTKNDATKTETELKQDDSEGCTEFPYYATSERQECQIVKPRQVIMGDWPLVRNREGVEWFVPFRELRVNTPTD